MNKLKEFNNLKSKMITTSEVLQSSFNNVFDKLKVEDFVLVENQRKKEVLVIQPLDKYINRYDIEIPIHQSFEGPVLTTSQNILLAKQMMKENVYYLMRFESRNITFPDIEMILSSGKFRDEFEKDVTINLINGWKYIITLPKGNVIDVFKNIQAIVAKDQALEIGAFRKGNVFITGTNYEPPLPTDEKIFGLFNEFNVSTNVYQGAATLLVKLIKVQPFYDGNKRSAFLIVNKLLIERAKGIISVSENQFEMFNTLLNAYYNNENKLNELVFYLVENCFYNTQNKTFVM